MSNLSEIWPKKENKTQAANIEVALLIMGNQKEDYNTFSLGLRQDP
jgi:hypothetical protein